MGRSGEQSSSRRDFVLALGMGVLGTARARAAHASVSRSLPGWRDWADGPVQIIRKAAQTAPMSVQALRGGLSVISGNGGNVSVLAQKDATLLVDSGIAGSRVSSTLATITPTPVTHLINSHWHFDHTDANAWHAARGARIIAQTNTRKHLLADTRVEDWDFTFPASAPSAIPQEVFATTKTLNVGAATIRLDTYAPAHTDADIAIHFEQQDVLHVADTWWNGVYPFIDYSTGGSIDGMIAAAERNLARVTAKTIIVPGHGPVGNKVQLIAWRDMLVDVRGAVAKLKQQGRSIDDVLKARPTKAYDATWVWPVIDGAFFTRLVYKGV